MDNCAFLCTGINQTQYPLHLLDIDLGSTGGKHTEFLLALRLTLEKW